MSHSNNTTKAILAISILGAFIFMLGKSFSWAKYALGSIVQRFKGKPNLSIEELNDLLASSSELQVQFLNPRATDVFNARLFDNDGVEITYTAFWEAGLGKTERITARWEGKRGMEFTLVEGAMTEFKRSGTTSSQPELWHHDSKLLSQCGQALKKRLYSGEPVMHYI